MTWYRTFRRIIIPSASVTIGLTLLEDEGTTILRNVGNYLPEEATPFPESLNLYTFVVT